MPELTPNLGLKKPLGNERVTRANYNENLDIIDAAAVKKGNGIAELIGGTLADRPDPGVAGRYYFAQDKGEIWLDTGTEWVLAAASNAELVAHLADDAPHNMAYQHGSGHYIANNGYVKLPDGTIIQCANSGYITLTEAGIRSIDVLLPIVFPNAVGQAIAVVSHVAHNYTATVKIVIPFTNKVRVVVESEAQVIAISVIAIGW